MNIDAVELGPRKGRGAVTNKVGRFERQDRVLTDDGWDIHDPRRDEPPPKLRPKSSSQRDLVAGSAGRFGGR